MFGKKKCFICRKRKPIRGSYICSVCYAGLKMPEGGSK